MNDLIVAVVAICAVFSFLTAKHYFRYKSGLTVQGAQTDQLQSEINALKQRIATLEAIVTDPGYQFKRDIERL